MPVYNIKEFFMKNKIKVLRTITLVAVIGFSLAACDTSTSPSGNDDVTITINAIPGMLPPLAPSSLHGRQWNLSLLNSTGNVVAAGSVSGLNFGTPRVFTVSVPRGDYFVRLEVTPGFIHDLTDDVPTATNTHFNGAVFRSNQISITGNITQPWAFFGFVQQ